MRLNHYILRQFFVDILKLSDKNYQTVAWLSEDSTESFIDIYNDFKSDLDVEDILVRPTHETGLSENLKSEIAVLSNLLLQIDVNGKSDKQIISNPNWHSIL